MICPSCKTSRPWFNHPIIDGEAHWEKYECSCGEVFEVRPSPTSTRKEP